jgi:hypothetical protein
MAIEPTCKWCKRYSGHYIGLVTIVKGGKLHKYRVGRNVDPGDRRLWTCCAFLLDGQGGR